MTKDAARATDADYEFSALTRRITWAEVTAARPLIWREMTTGIVMVVIGLLYWWWWFQGPRPQLPDEWWFVSGLIEIVVGILSVVMGFAVLVGFLFAISPLTERRDLRVRLFAAENAFVHRPYGEAPPRVGIVFGGEGGVEVKDQLIDPGSRTVRSRTGTLPVFISLGNATLYTKPKGGKGGESRGTVGYLHAALTAQSPHYLLDGRANNRWVGGRIGSTLQTNQKLQLEGDFNEHFTLYCPPGRERDALQIFTPDVMALLIDHGSTWDVEIIDDNLFVYSTRTLEPRRSDDIARLLTFADLVVPKLGGRIERARPGDMSVRSNAPGRASRNLLTKRSAWILWMLGILAGIVGFGYVLTWVLDAT